MCSLFAQFGVLVGRPHRPEKIAWTIFSILFILASINGGYALEEQIKGLDGGLHQIVLTSNPDEGVQQHMREGAHEGRTVAPTATSRQGAIKAGEEKEEGAAAGGHHAGSQARVSVDMTSDWMGQKVPHDPSSSFSSSASSTSWKASQGTQGETATGATGRRMQKVSPTGVTATEVDLGRVRKFALALDPELMSNAAPGEGLGQGYIGQG